MYITPARDLSRKFEGEACAMSGFLQSGGGGQSGVIPAIIERESSGISLVIWEKSNEQDKDWIPAFTGMTRLGITLSRQQ